MNALARPVPRPRALMICGGGTGGHLFPGVAIAQAWRRRHPKAPILFVGTSGGIEAHAVPRAGFEVAFLRVGGLRGKTSAQRLQAAARLPGTLWSAVQLVRRFRPSIVVSVGGYAAGPATLAAQMLGLPTVVIEQNAIAGWTSRLLAPMSTQIVTALPNLQLPAGRSRVLGNPVREELLPVRDAPYALQGPLNLLVLGGSQGARALNSAVMAALPLMLRRGLPFRLVHQTGQGDADRVRTFVAAHKLNEVTVHAFIDDMARAWRTCDLAICRAGATTLAELTVCGRPSILVPLPTAAGDHQSANARALAQVGAAIHLPQGELTGSQLADQLGALQAQPTRLADMAAKARSQGRPRALDDIVDLLVGCARHV